MEINKNEKTIVLDLKDIIIFALLIVIIVLFFLLISKKENNKIVDIKDTEKIEYESDYVKQDDDKIEIEESKKLSMSSNANLDESEKMVEGWKMIDDKWHYYTDNGEMAKNTILLISGKHYYFDSKGVLKTSGWFRYKKSHYYAREDGSINYDMIYESETETESTTEKVVEETKETVESEISTKNVLEKRANAITNSVNNGPRVSNVEIVGPGEEVLLETVNDNTSSRINTNRNNYELKEIEVSNKYKSENGNETEINISLPELYENGVKDNDFNACIENIRENILDNLYIEIENFEDNEDYIKSIEYEKNELTNVTAEGIEIKSTNEYKTQEDKSNKIVIIYQYDLEEKDIYYEIIMSS